MNLVRTVIFVLVVGVLASVGIACIIGLLID